MSGKIIAQTLIALVTGGQCGLVALRAKLAEIQDDETGEQFYEAMAEAGDEIGKQVFDALASHGLVPYLLPGMHSPLELTIDGTEYAFPDEANRFLALQFGAAKSAPGADAAADAATLLPAGMPPVVAPIGLDSGLSAAFKKIDDADESEQNFGNDPNNIPDPV
jgi:hypothetical protein